MTDMERWAAQAVAQLPAPERDRLAAHAVVLVLAERTSLPYEHDRDRLRDIIDGIAPTFGRALRSATALARKALNHE